MDSSGSDRLSVYNGIHFVDFSQYENSLRNPNSFTFLVIGGYISPILERAYFTVFPEKYYFWMKSMMYTPPGDICMHRQCPRLLYAQNVNSKSYWRSMFTILISKLVEICRNYPNARLYIELGFEMEYFLQLVPEILRKHIYIVSPFADF